MQTAIECTSHGLTLRGMLHRPVGADQVPLVIMYHDFMATKTENKFIYVELSRELEKRGIASVRFDFMGCGESDGEMHQRSYRSDLDGASDILAYAHALPFVDRNRIAIVGKGTGGMIACQMASKVKEALQALLLLSPMLNCRHEAYAEELRNAEPEPLASATAKVLLVHGDQEASSELMDRCRKVYGDRMTAQPIADVHHVVETVAARERMMEQAIAFLTKQLLG